MKDNTTSSGDAEPVKSLPNSYSPSTESSYETAASDTAVSNFREIDYSDNFEKKESGGGVTLVLSLIAILLFIRWLSKR